MIGGHVGVPAVVVEISVVVRDPAPLEPIDGHAGPGRLGIVLGEGRGDGWVGRAIARRGYKGTETVSVGSENRVGAYSFRGFAVVEGPIPTVIGIPDTGDQIRAGNDQQPIPFTSPQYRLVPCVQGGSLPILGDTDNINVLHRTVRWVGVAGQRLGSAQSIVKVHSHLEPFAEIGLGRQIGLGVIADIRCVQRSVGVYPNPLVGELGGYAVGVHYGGCDGRQLQADLCRTSEGGRAGRRRGGRIDYAQDGHAYGYVEAAVSPCVVGVFELGLSSN